MSFDISAPKGWQLVKLSDLGEVNRGKSKHRPRDAHFLYGGKYPFIQTGDVKASSGRINSFNQTYSNEGLKQSRLWPVDTMCITIAANIAETGVLQFPACFPDSVIGFIADKTKCDVYFIEYMFRLLKAKIKAQANGSVQENINLQTLERIHFPIPDLATQEKIAQALGVIDDKIVQNNQMNETLEQMAQALFKSWFVDFEPVKAKIAVLEAGGSQAEATLAAMTAISGKDADALAVFEREHPEQYAELKATAELFPASMQESEMGGIPEGWDSQRLSNLATLHYGKALKKTERIEGPYPVYGSGGVTGSHNNYLVEGPGIVVGRKGSIGTLYWEDGKFHPIDTVYYVANKKGIPLSYLYYLMKTLNLPNMNTDAAVPGLNRDNVYRLEVLKPAQSILSKFDDHMSTIKNIIQKNDNSTVTLTDLRDTLLPKLLSGEINLPEAEQSVSEVENV